ncbi:MAG: DUF3068 domain-containing protein [Nocardioidaceae bacterium]|nr:DUF3068 domain-containing protein [Nocardioidaceae bacterium]MCL2613695.1 DUF3068 domain-containing protein [Nocardioidaceae bacterium]
MRRIIGTALVGLGVFLVVAAALIRFYAYPSLARVPTNYDETTHLQAKDARIFNTNPKVLAPETTNLTVAARTVADSSIHPPAGDAVWNTNTTITRADGTIFQRSRERAPFDAVTGAAVSCASCGSWSESTQGQQDTVDRSGQVYKFPFDTQRHDYQNWDDAIGAATTAKYEGQTSIQGLKVYKFVQTIAPRIIGHEQVPGSVFGSKAASVDAAMWYAMTRTLYIEPATGSPVQRIEQRTQEMRYDGTTVPAFDGTVEYTPAQVTDEVNTLSTNAMLLSGARLWIPVGGLLLGLVLLGAGLVMTRREPQGHEANRGHGVDRPLVGV